jgi:drug/metabolite transporter (DMT)-like permease
MTEALVVAIAAATLLGVYIVGVKQYFNDYPPTAFVALSYAIGAVWYFPLVAVRIPVDKFWRTLTDHGFVLVVLAIITALALVAFYTSLVLGDVSYIAPLSKTVPVFVLPLEVLALRQSITRLQLLGIVTVTIAIYVINYQGGSVLAPVFRLFKSRAAGLAIISAILFAVVDVGKRVSMQELAIPTEIFVFTTLIFVAVLLSPFISRNHDSLDLANDRRRLLLAGGVLSLGQHLVATAFETLPASVASPIVNAQAVVAALVGGVLLKEPNRYFRGAAALVAIIGIGMLSIGQPG